jgi:hypothetical protein
MGMHDRFPCSNGSGHSLNISYMINTIIVKIQAPCVISYIVLQSGDKWCMSHDSTMLWISYDLVGKKDEKQCF